MPGDANACIDAVAHRQITETASRTTQFRGYTAHSTRTGLRFRAKGMNGDHTRCQGCGHESCCQEFLHLCSFHVDISAQKVSDPIILVFEQSSSRPLAVLIELHCPKMAHRRAKSSEQEFASVTRSFPERFMVQKFPEHRQFCPIPEGPAQPLCGEGRSSFGL